MHHMAIALDEELVGDPDRAGLRDSADIIAPKIEQHQMLGALLGIDHQLFGKSGVFIGGLSPPARGGDSPGAHPSVSPPPTAFPAPNPHCPTPGISETT